MRKRYIIKIAVLALSSTGVIYCVLVKSWRKRNQHLISAGFEEEADNLPVDACVKVVTHV